MRKNESIERAEQAERTERVELVKRPEWVERTERIEQSERSERPERLEWMDKACRGPAEPGAETVRRKTPMLVCLPGPRLLSDSVLSEAVSRRLVRAGVRVPERETPVAEPHVCPLQPFVPKALAVATLVEAALDGAEVLWCAGPGRMDGAPLEQVAAALYFAGFSDISVPEIVEAVVDICRMAGLPIPAHAPVIGERIFHVGTGIHVDGLLKDTTTYEPWAPGWLGHRRVFVAGRLSGRASEKISRGGAACCFD